MMNIRFGFTCVVVDWAIGVRAKSAGAACAAAATSAIGTTAAMRPSLRRMLRRAFEVVDVVFMAILSRLKTESGFR